MFKKFLFASDVLPPASSATWGYASRERWEEEDTRRVVSVHLTSVYVHQHRLVIN